MSKILKIDLRSQNAPTDFVKSLSESGFAIIENHNIDQDLIDNIDLKVKEWQSKSSYDGNYFEWKAKK